MGEREEPMQWVLARHRQNSGEQLPPDEETDNLTDYLPLAVCAHAGQPARRGTDSVTRLLSARFNAGLRHIS